MDLLFLGTSAGAPTKTRNVSALALLPTHGSGWYLIDCGEATQHQLLHTPLSVRDLRTIFITHVHGDHCYGLPGLLASAAMSGRKNPLTIVAPKDIEAWLLATLTYTQVELPFAIDFQSTETLTQWQCGAMTVSAIELSHRVPSYAYRFHETYTESQLNVDKLVAQGIPKGELWGQFKQQPFVTFEGKSYTSSDYVQHTQYNHTIIVCGDNDTPTLLAPASTHCDVLVHEATFTQAGVQKIGHSYGHSYAKQVASFAQQRHIPNLVLTHFSPRYSDVPNNGQSIDSIQTEAMSAYFWQLHIAKDFARYRLGRDGVLQLV